jgi:hypothetical protein
LTDHDWDVEGGAGGAAGGSGGATSPREADSSGREADGSGREADGSGREADGSGREADSSRAEADSSRAEADAPAGRSANVVAFPGNWFGSVDDLVPVHPEPLVPVHPEPVLLHPESRDPVVEIASPPADAPDQSAADASDFWEGDAATLREVSAAEDSRASIALLRSPAAASRKSSSRLTASGTPSSGESEPAAAEPTDFHKRRVPLPALVTVLLAAVVGGALLAVHSIPGVLNSAAARHPGRLAAATQHKPRRVTQTITSRVTVTTTAPPRTRRHGTKGIAGRRTGGAKARGAASGGRSSDQGGASSNGEASSNNASPPVTASHSSATTPSTGSGCVVSPDSGCMP